jgi:DNA gyrase subunit A
MFKDIEIVPMVDNFDNSQKEPKPFLPLLPMVLVNPQEGIAVGFACNIISRDIKDIINHQIDYLSRGKIPKTEAIPYFGPLDQRSVDHIVDANGKIKWLFRGTYERNSATELTITALPYGLSHDKVIGKLERLIDGGTLLNIEDNSRDKYKIKLKFKKRVLSSMDDDQIIKMIGLDSSQTENLNVIDFDGQRVWGSAYCDTIVKYCDWRLSWYITRYQRLADLIQIDIQKLKDVITAIEKNVGGQARKMASRSEMKEYLEAIGIVHLDYIADLPVYRFTEQEREKTQIKLDEALVTLDHYNELIASEDKRKQVYVDELIEVRNNIPKYTSNKK